MRMRTCSGIFAEVCHIKTARCVPGRLIDTAKKPTHPWAKRVDSTALRDILAAGRAGSKEYDGRLSADL